MQRRLVLLCRLSEATLDERASHELCVWTQEKGYVCRAAYTCSSAPLRPSVGQTTARDMHFIVWLVLDYWGKNERRILHDALAIDPHRGHQLEVYIDLRPAVIEHTIRLVGQRPSEDTAWATELFAVWLDHGYRKVSCGVFKMPDGHEEAA